MNAKFSSALRKSGVVLKALIFLSRRAGFNFQLCYKLFPVWPWVNPLIFPCLCSPSVKWGYYFPTSQGCYENKYIHPWPHAHPCSLLPPSFLLWGQAPHFKKRRVNECEVLKIRGWCEGCVSTSINWKCHWEWKTREKKCLTCVTHRKESFSRGPWISLRALPPTMFHEASVALWRWKNWSSVGVAASWIRLHLQQLPSFLSVQMFHGAWGPAYFLSALVALGRPPLP